MTPKHSISSPISYDTSIPSGHGKTVVVGMSGGVDSSVAALLLKEAGYRVLGLFMKNWDDAMDQTGTCSAEADYRDVESVCERLGITYYSIEFVEEYRERVFASFIRDYQSGSTPNPDILCNREIKFDLFYEKAHELGADFLATGHYARISRSTSLHAETDYRLIRGRDPDKDQSYFIYTIPPKKLPKILFPIGDLIKPEVRKLATAAGLSTAQKKDSTGICFIGERRFREFLSQYVPSKPGEFVRWETGKVCGRHQGAAFYTLGQRRGLGLGGEGERWYVVDKDMNRNIVYVARGDDHPALFRDWLHASELSFTHESSYERIVRNTSNSLTNQSITAKIRYRQEDQLIQKVSPIMESSEDTCRVEFAVPQRSMNTRQAIVFYDGEECLGGGMITCIGPHHSSKNAGLSGGQSPSE